MGFLDNLRKQAASQFIEVVEWLDESSDAIVYRFPVYNQEIKMGAQLTVRENQRALFVNEGQAADIFAPGRHTLSTRNVPILTTLRGWKHGFKSPFKAEVYFFNTRLYTDQKWGTASPVMMKDRELGMVRLRAFGTYAFKVADAKAFFAAIVGTRGLTTTDEITGQLRSTILTRFSDIVAESGVPALELAGNYDELSALCRTTLAPEFALYGLELSRFFVENISLPEDVQAAIDQRSRLGALGSQLDSFGRLQAAEAMTMAASNPSGAAGAGMGLGAGIAAGQAMLQSLGPAGAGQHAPAPQGAPARWSVAQEGKTFGPYTDQAILEMLRSGQIAASTQIWRPGAPGWAPLSSHPEFAHAVAPPPPPPGGGR